MPYFSGQSFSSHSRSSQSSSHHYPLHHPTSPQRQSPTSPPPEPPSLKKTHNSRISISVQPSAMQIHDFPSQTLNNPDSRPSKHPKTP
ncbi:hypothetical protein M440DRAFT_1398828 [Trichoderma longibrachiatum ATCC 18648]|uniref:Uncharacterized protein n=1 Tax=Trichoderma longibrachiatum ATCC 18648 TaxID=983965 RepID=A0A2T4CD78_TRILO|nr:hypothetical protein M440DRAFT_1398828 [Trichoderma longibrachiatum ATCC 18648]